MISVSISETFNFSQLNFMDAKVVMKFRDTVVNDYSKQLPEIEQAGSSHP